MREQKNEKFDMTTVEGWVEWKVQGMTSHEIINYSGTILFKYIQAMKSIEHFEDGQSQNANYVFQSQHRTYITVTNITSEDKCKLQDCYNCPWGRWQVEPGTLVMFWFVCFRLGTNTIKMDMSENIHFSDD